MREYEYECYIYNPYVEAHFSLLIEVILSSSRKYRYVPLLCSSANKIESTSSSRVCSHMQSSDEFDQSKFDTTCLGREGGGAWPRRNSNFLVLTPVSSNTTVPRTWVWRRRKQTQPGRRRPICRIIQLRCMISFGDLPLLPRAKSNSGSR
ncbi:hypothetical protein EJ08DRAFT_460633 [Tothia fuscella]|uniref:Uncharacterized protein n=1 Tax=Tothia fuscella TaxID=1048955 RepID=A0A9P4NIL6_9PEZI|nr:hypothetical protein EJ08DRAFT_460633 [Tothia fuscella]